MIQKKHLCWMIFVEILFLLVNLVVEGNYLIGLQMYSNSATNHENADKYSLGSYLFTDQLIKFHFIIFAILTDLLLFIASFCQLWLLVKQPLHMFIHRIQSINNILIVTRIILGIAEHIQDASTFDEDSIQIACKQSSAGQSNQGCNLLFGRTLLLAFIYISEFFVLASIISFRYYYKIYLREPAISNSSKLVADLLQQDQTTQQQVNQLEKNAEMISVELSEKTEHQEYIQSQPSNHETANSARLKQMYLTNRVLNVETNRVSSIQSSPLHKQFTTSGLSNVSPGETLTTSVQHSPLTKSSTIKSKKQRESMPSFLTNPVFTANAKSSFTQSLQGGQKPFSLLLQSTRMSQTKQSNNNSNPFQTNSSDSSSNNSQPQSPTLELGLKKGISEKVREEESEEEDPRFVPNPVFRTEKNKKIPPLAIVPSTLIVGHGVAKASAGILANAISTSIGTSVGSEIVEAAASPFRAIFSKVFNSFLNKK